MEEKNRPRYSMWQNTAFMIRTAWRVRKSVLFLVLALAVTGAARSAAELLIAPSVLRTLETGGPLAALLTVTAFCAAVLFVLAFVNAYLQANTLPGRVHVRLNLVRQIAGKLASTSYPNLLDGKFMTLESKSSEACADNRSAAEDIWRIWTEILKNGLGFLLYLALLSDLNFGLMVLVTATASIHYLAGRRISEWGYRHREEEMDCRKKLDYLRRISEDRRMGKDVRMFGLHTWLEELWDGAERLYQSFVARREKHYLLADLLDLLLTFLQNGAAYAYLLYVTVTQGLPASQFLLYFGAISGFAQWVTGLLEQFMELYRQSQDISAIREFLEWPEPFAGVQDDGADRIAGRAGGGTDRIAGRAGGGTDKKIAVPSGASCVLCLEDVCFRYPGADKDTISHVNLTIAPGEKLAVVGLNGAGKTTLVKLLCGFLDPTSGRVLLNGEDIRGYRRSDYYTLFSAVFQDFSVLEASVAENVAQCRVGMDLERVRRCIDQAGLTEKIGRLPAGIHTKLGRRVFEDGVELSGGQLQRLMLARALYRDAPILLLDEPTAALDPIAERDIYQRYSEMTEGKTSVFISHRLASTRFCDRILFVADGRIAEEGTHESLLLLGGGYAELFELQSRYYREGGTPDAY